MYLTGPLRAAASGLALIAIAATAQPARAQEPDWQFADVLAPHYAKAPQQDILDLTLGMSLDQATVALVGQGFRLKGSSLGRTARGAGNMRYLEADRDRSGGQVASQRITLYFDFSERPRVLAIYRESSYPRDRRPAYSTVMSAILAKYGDAPVYDTRFNEVMASWHPSGMSRKCQPMRVNFRYFRAPTDIEGYEGCYRGLAIKVIYRNNLEGRPVEYTRTFLVDSRLLDANYKETFRLAREQQAQRRQQRRDDLADRPAAEF